MCFGALHATRKRSKLQKRLNYLTEFADTCIEKNGVTLFAEVNGFQKTASRNKTEIGTVDSYCS